MTFTQCITIALVAGAMATGAAQAQTTTETVQIEAAEPADAAAEEDSLQIYFDTGRATVRTDQRRLLDQAARLYRDGNPIVMVVAGNADTVGSAEKNLDLSIQRARAVANGLVDRGIPIERLQILGRGNSELPVATDNGVPNEENRSVTITWR